MISDIKWAQFVQKGVVSRKVGMAMKIDPTRKRTDILSTPYDKILATHLPGYLHLVYSD